MVHRKPILDIFFYLKSFQIEHTRLQQINEKNNGLKTNLVWTKLKGCQNTDMCNKLHLQSMVPTKRDNNQSIL